MTEITVVPTTPLEAAFDRITSQLRSSSFCPETHAVLYSKLIPGSTMSFDQWLEYKDGKIQYTSRFMQLDEGHPDYPVQAEYTIDLPVEQAEAVAKHWIAEENTASTIERLRSTIRLQTLEI